MEEEAKEILPDATMAELLTALKQRTDEMFFVGRPKSRDGEGFDWMQAWGGPSFYSAVGLTVCAVVTVVVKELMERAKGEKTL